MWFMSRFYAADEADKMGLVHTVEPASVEERRLSLTAETHCFDRVATKKKHCFEPAGELTSIRFCRATLSNGTDRS